MTSRTLGKRYAKALIEVVAERGEPADAVLADLERVQDALTADPKFLALLVNPKLPVAQRLGAMDRVLEAIAPGPRVRGFLQLLVRKGRIPLLPDIVHEYRSLADTRAGLVRAAVSSAAPLTDAEVDRLAALLRQRFGKTVALTMAVDPELIGGLVIRVGSLSFDGSIRAQLKTIQSQLLEEVSFS